MEAEIGYEASRTFLKPIPGATCLNNTTISVQTILPPSKQGAPSSLQFHPAIGSPACDTVFYRGVTGTYAAAAARTRFSRAPRLALIPHGGSRPSSRPLYPYILGARC